MKQVRGEAVATRIARPPMTAPSAQMVDDMRMRRPEHNADRLGMSRENLGKRIDDLFDLG